MLRTSHAVFHALLVLGVTCWPAKAETIYQAYTGGVNGTLLVQFTTPTPLNGTTITNFADFQVLPSYIQPGGNLFSDPPGIASVNDAPHIQYNSPGNNSWFGFWFGAATASDGTTIPRHGALPTSGTYTLDPVINLGRNGPFVAGDKFQDYADTIVITDTDAPEPATLLLAAIGILGQIAGRKIIGRRARIANG